jgi:hypothetical protein
VKEYEMNIAELKIILNSLSPKYDNCKIVSHFGDDRKFSDVEAYTPNQRKEIFILHFSQYHKSYGYDKEQI